MGQGHIQVSYYEVVGIRIRVALLRKDLLSNRFSHSCHSYIMLTIDYNNYFEKSIKNQLINPID